MKLLPGPLPHSISNRSVADALYICRVQPSQPHIPLFPACARYTRQLSKIGNEVDASTRDEPDAPRVRQQWCRQGLPEETRSARMAQSENGEKSTKVITPTEETLSQFPVVSGDDLARWELTDGKCLVTAESIGFQALQLVFPGEAVGLIVDQVRRYSVFILPSNV